MAGEPHFPGRPPQGTRCDTITNRHTGQAMFDTLEADILVMQETKIQRKDLSDDMVMVPGWDVYFSLPKYKKGSTHTLRSPKSC
jgi:AP endonuclease-2